MRPFSLPKIAHALGLAPTASGTEIIAAVATLKNDVAAARSAATHAAILTGNDISTIAKAVGLSSTATKDELVAAIRKLDATKTTDANALRLVSLVLGLPAESTRDAVVAELQRWDAPQSPAVDLITSHASYLVERSGGKLSYAAALKESARDLPYAAAASGGDRPRGILSDVDREIVAARYRLERIGTSASDELAQLVTARMSAKGIPWTTAMSEIRTERPEVFAAATHEIEVQRVAIRTIGGTGR